MILIGWQCCFLFIFKVEGFCKIKDCLRFDCCNGFSLYFGFSSMESLISALFVAVFCSLFSEIFRSSAVFSTLGIITDGSRAF